MRKFIIALAAVGVMAFASNAMAADEHNGDDPVPVPAPVEPSGD